MADQHSPRSSATDLTEGSLFGKMLAFSVPYLISCFLQTFYGLADLFITGLFHGADAISAVAIGSQVMHMLTVVTVGLAVGTTVSISHAVGARDRKRAEKCMGNSVTIFFLYSLVVTAVLIFAVDAVASLLQTPPEALPQAKDYLRICFAGIPFITAYNISSSVFRGLGDTRRPMYFVAASGVMNIGLDWLLIGPLHMGAAGAALATVASQAASAVMAFVVLRKKQDGVRLRAENLQLEGSAVREILQVGVPIAFQESLIQLSFLVITAIANSRGVEVAAAVGIVEKVICFLFLVPSAMLSTVSAVTAQNVGAGKHLRGRDALKTGCAVVFVFGAVVFLLCQLFAPQIVSAFTAEPGVIRFGAQYLRSYTVDCMIAGIHFCFSGYFSAYGKSGFSFLHNILSVLLVRIPGAYFASVWFPETLYPMGLAAPMGSLLSVGICLYLFRRYHGQFGL